MTIGTKYVNRLVPADVQQVRDCLELLDDYRVACEVAAEGLARIKGFTSEQEKLSRSAAALRHERTLVHDRLQALLDVGKRYGGCPVCGCALAERGAICALCGGNPISVHFTFPPLAS